MPNKQYNVKSPQGWRKGQVRSTSNNLKKQSPRRIPTQSKHPKVKRTIFKRLLIWGTSATLIFFIISFIFIAWISQDLPTTTVIENRKLTQSTRIFDRTGTTILWEVYDTEQRTPINLVDLPNHIKWAAIVAEDRNFYSHGGIKFTSIIRAALSNVLRGGRGQGGSTITQQFIKNSLLTTEKTYIRKLKEAILAWQLEKRFSKDEILELYLNEIPYGSVAYGVEAASNRYFNKKAAELNLAEAATIAALPQSPTYYSPYGPHKDELTKRTNFIINSMVSEGYISTKESEIAKSTKLKFNTANSSIRAPHFVFYIREQLASMYGEEVIENGGLKVITTLDLFKQDVAEEIITEKGEYNAENFEASNSAMLVMDPKNGQILSMVGSRDFFNKDIDGEVNVTLRPRQPGSSFKPIVYATSFIEGLTPDTILFDLPTTFRVEPEEYEPKNYNNAIHGPVTIRQSLGSSLNIPAVKTTYLVGIDKVLNFADKLHYSTFKDRSRFGLSIVLGGAEVTMLEHLSAYNTFAREGIYHKPVSILKIEDSKGRVLLDNNSKKNEGEQIFDPQIAKLVNSILFDNEARQLTFSPNNYLFLGERPVAAKTGTTNDFRDAWTIGYTPSIAVAVWVGNNDNSTMSKGATGGAVASPIWNAFMKRILGDTAIEFFSTPEGYNTSTKPMINGKFNFKNKVSVDSNSGLLATEYTPSTTKIEKTFSEVHNILHYVRPGNISGPAPNKPWEESNYTSWEIPIEKWLKEQNITQGETPTKFDDIHLKKDKPKITNIQAPKVLSENNFIATFSVNSHRGIRRVDYYVGNTKVLSKPISGVKSLVNESQKITINSIQNGTHQFKIAVYDDLENEDIIFQPILIDIIGN